MPVKRAPPSGPVRFTYEAVVQHIEAFLADPRTPKGMRKRLEAACNLDHSAFSHRMSQYRGERFRIEHFGAMAAEADAPTPWPFVPWTEAERYEAFRKLLELTAKRTL